MSKSLLCPLEVPSWTAAQPAPVPLDAHEVESGRQVSRVLPRIMMSPLVSDLKAPVNGRVPDGGSALTGATTDAISPAIRMNTQPSDTILARGEGCVPHLP